MEFYTLAAAGDEQTQRQIIEDNSPFPDGCDSSFQYDALNEGFVFDIQLGSCNMESTMVTIDNSKYNSFYIIGNANVK